MRVLRDCDEIEKIGARMEAIRKELVFQLRGGHAHAPLEKVVKGFPFEKQGMVPKGLPYSGWQLLEHIRLALEDMVEFSASPNYKEKKWPEGYWPKSAEPPNKTAWVDSVKKIEAEIEKFVKLISDPEADLFKPFPWGDGQTLFREAWQIVDHNAYHLGELVAVRRVLGEWPQ
jgi:hypothetical protein